MQYSEAVLSVVGVVETAAVSLEKEHVDVTKNHLVVFKSCSEFDLIKL
jgi:hypothetical protein